MPSVRVVANFKVKNFVDELGQKSQQEFLLACTRTSKLLEKNQKIVFDLNDVPAPIVFEPNKLVQLDSLSFNISTNDICSIMQQVVNFVRNHFLVTAHLKDLDTALGKAMLEQGITFDEKEFPQSLIASFGHFIPDVPNSNYLPRSKKQILGNLLLTGENNHFINIQGYAPKFVDFVEEELSNEIIANGNIFSENFQITRMLFHGPAHRLLLAALMNAEKKKVLNFTLSNGKKLLFREFLELMVKVGYDDAALEKEMKALWIIIFDSTFDVVNSMSQNRFDSTNFKFVCRVPESFHSLLRDFGHYFGLPNLRFYLLDSFYKTSLQYVGRTRKYNAENGFNFKISDHTFFYNCMNFLTTVTKKFGEVGHPCFFTLTREQALQNPTYTVVYPKSNVVQKKKPQHQSFAAYKSWSDYYEFKVGKASKSNQSLKNSYNKFFKDSENKNSLNKKKHLNDIDFVTSKIGYEMK